MQQAAPRSERVRRYCTRSEIQLDVQELIGSALIYSVIETNLNLTGTSIVVTIHVERVEEDYLLRVPNLEFR